MINFLIVDKIIKNALIEDIPNEDITTNSIAVSYTHLDVYKRQPQHI